MSGKRGPVRVLASTAASALAPRLVGMAPTFTTGFLHTALERALIGVGPLPPAAEAAEKQLAEQHGDRSKAVREVIENHVAYAAAGGFATNLGGLVTAAVTIPTNVAGLALLQCRMVAGIAHLRGHDLDDPRVRNAILVCLLGEDKVDAMVRKQRLPAPPMALATAPAFDLSMNRTVANEVATEMMARVAGKRVAVVASKRIPVVGGVVGAGADGWTTLQIGRYAARELLPRPGIV